MFYVHRQYNLEDCYETVQNHQPLYPAHPHLNYHSGFVTKSTRKE